MMAASRLKIQTVGVGICASMAAVMLAAGTPGMRLMTPSSYVMTHQFAEGMEGKFFELVAHRGHQDEMHDKFIEFFVKRTKMNTKQVKDILLGSTDKMLTPKECIKYGLVDVVKNPWDQK
jgi:ATP-dependent Clp protease protease subunit